MRYAVQCHIACVEDEELREWLAVFARAIMELRELVLGLGKEDDEDGEEEDSA